MRHFLLALLIALLPIRGWVGNAMAVGMVSHGPAAPAGHLATSVPPAAPVALDCLEHSPAAHAAIEAMTQAVEHAAAANAAHAEAGAPHGEHADLPDTSHQAHAACELCNGPAMALGWSATPLPPAAHGLAVARTVHFASTVPPLGIKPPIS